MGKAQRAASGYPRTIREGLNEYGTKTGLTLWQQVGIVYFPYIDTSISATSISCLICCDLPGAEKHFIQQINQSTWIGIYPCPW